MNFIWNEGSPRRRNEGSLYVHITGVLHIQMWNATRHTHTHSQTRFKATLNKTNNNANIMQNFIYTNIKVGIMCGPQVFQVLI